MLITEFTPDKTLNKEKIKVMIYGVCPYGNGGISNHIKRLVSYVKKNEPSVDLSYYHHDKCYSSEKCGLYASAYQLINIYRKNKYDVVQIYSLINWKVQLYTYLSSFFLGFKIILSLRNDRFPDTYNSLRFFEKLILKLFFSRIDKFVCVNSEADYLFIDRKKICIIPGFIQPADDEYNRTLPQKILDFIDSHELILATNATAPKIHNGVDLYGFDLAIDLMAELKKQKFNGAGMVFLMPEINLRYKPHFDEMINRISALNLREDFLVWDSPVSFPALLKKSDLSLRLTSNDGDSSSVRESLSLGVPVVGSDAAPRPDGTVLFRSRDLHDLTCKTAHLIENLDDWKNDFKKTSPVDNAQKMIHLWHSLS